MDNNKEAEAEARQAAAEFSELSVSVQKMYKPVAQESDEKTELDKSDETQDQTDSKDIVTTTDPLKPNLELIENNINELEDEQGKGETLASLHQSIIQILKNSENMTINSLKMNGKQVCKENSELVVVDNPVQTEHTQLVQEPADGIEVGDNNGSLSFEKPSPNNEIETAFDHEINNPEISIPDDIQTEDTSCVVKASLRSNVTNNGCSQCANLNQEILTLRKQSQMNLSIFKQKLISTSDLITEYHKKCQELKEQKLKISELNKKLENCYGETGSLRIQLEKALQASEPMKKTIRRFEYEKMMQQSAVDDLTQKLNKKTAELTEIKELISSCKSSEELHRSNKDEIEKLHEKEKKKVLNQAKQIDKLNLQLKTAKDKTKENAKQLKAAIRDKEKLSRRIEKLEKTPKVLSKGYRSSGKASRSSPNGVLSPSPSPPISPSPLPPSPPPPPRAVARKNSQKRPYLTRSAVRRDRKSSSSSANSSSHDVDQNISSSNDGTDSSDDDIDNLQEMLMEKLEKQIGPSLMKQWNAATILSPPLSPMPPSPDIRNNDSSEDARTSTKGNFSQNGKSILQHMQNLVDKEIDRQADKPEDNSLAALNEVVPFNDNKRMSTDVENIPADNDQTSPSNLTYSDSNVLLPDDTEDHDNVIMSDTALDIDDSSSDELHPAFKTTAETQDNGSGVDKVSKEHHTNPTPISVSEDSIILKKEHHMQNRNDNKEGTENVRTEHTASNFKDLTVPLDSNTDTLCSKETSKSDYHIAFADSKSTSNDNIDVDTVGTNTTDNDYANEESSSLTQQSLSPSNDCDDDTTDKKVKSDTDEFEKEKKEELYQTEAFIEINHTEKTDILDGNHGDKNSSASVDYDKEPTLISEENIQGEVLLNVAEKSDNENSLCERREPIQNADNTDEETAEKKATQENEDNSHVNSFNHTSKISYKFRSQSKELDDVDFEVASFELSQNSLEMVPGKGDGLPQSTSTSNRTLEMRNHSPNTAAESSSHQQAQDQITVADEKEISKTNIVRFSLPEKECFSGYLSNKSSKRILRRHSMFENSSSVNPQLRTDRTRSLSPSMFKPPSPPLSPIPPSPRRSILTPIISPLPTTPLPESVSPLPPSPKITSPPLIRGTAVLHSENSSLCIPKPVTHKKLSAVKELTFTKNSLGIDSKSMEWLPKRNDTVNTEMSYDTAKQTNANTSEIEQVNAMVPLRSSIVSFNNQKEQQNKHYDFIESDVNLQSKNINTLSRKREGSSTISVPPKHKKVHSTQKPVLLPLECNSSASTPKHSDLSKPSSGMPTDSNEQFDDSKTTVTKNKKRVAVHLPFGGSDDDTLQIVTDSSHSQDEINTADSPQQTFKRPVKRIKHSQLTNNEDKTNLLLSNSVSTTSNVLSSKQPDKIRQEKDIKFRDRHQTEIGFALKILQKLPSSISLTNAILTLSERKNLTNPDNLIKALIKCLRTCEKSLLPNILKYLENKNSNTCLCESESDWEKNSKTSIYCSQCWNKSGAGQNLINHEQNPSLNFFHLLHPHAKKLNVPCLTLYEYYLLVVAHSINFKTFPSLVLKQLHKTIYVEKELLSCERMALFRFYAAVCRMYNKLDQLISFVYCIAYDEPEYISYPVLFVTCYSIWPSVVSRTDLFIQNTITEELTLFKIKMSPLSAVLQLVALCDAVNRKESTSQKILETLLSVRGIHSKHYAAVVDELFSLLCNKQLSYMDKNEEGHIMCPFAFSVLKGIELICTRLGWEWCYTNIIAGKIWKELQEWSMNNISDDTAAILIRLNGRLCRYAFACGFRDFKELTDFYSNFLQQICVDNTVHENIHIATVYTLLDMSPSYTSTHDRSVLRNWLKHAENRQFIISQSLRNAISICG